MKTAAADIFHKTTSADSENQFILHKSGESAIFKAKTY